MNVETTANYANYYYVAATAILGVLVAAWVLTRYTKRARAAIQRAEGAGMKVKATWLGPIPLFASVTDRSDDDETVDADEGMTKGARINLAQDISSRSFWLSPLVVIAMNSLVFALTASGLFPWAQQEPESWTHVITGEITQVTADGNGQLLVVVGDDLTFEVDDQAMVVGDDIEITCQAPSEPQSDLRAWAAKHGTVTGCDVTG